MSLQLDLGPEARVNDNGGTAMPSVRGRSLGDSVLESHSARE
jgi:hypothetical protein